MSNKLSGKVAVVTGASKGIGSQIALQLAAEGASVVVNYSSSKDAADNVMKQITSKGGKAIAVKASVSRPEEIKTLFAEVKKAFGHLDILVNNAGIYEFSPLEAVTPEHFHKQFDLNVLGLLLVTQEAATLLRPGGSIINISSLVSTGAIPGSSVYSATKASVDAITRVLSREFGARKIRVNSVNPGMVETEGTATTGMSGVDSELRKQIEATTPLGRIGQTQDIAPAVAFLASDDASWITGETLYITGGLR